MQKGQRFGLYLPTKEHVTIADTLAAKQSRSRNNLFVFLLEQAAKEAGLLPTPKTVKKGK